MNKLFTVGCSQTRYAWPTWADILGRSFSEFENWGHSGIGNRAIFERTVEMIKTSQVDETDMVMIQWTNPYRFDAHKINHDMPTRWASAGNITNWPKNLLETIHCDFSYVYHTCNFIVGCKNFLENKNINFVFLTMNALKPYILNYKELEIYHDELAEITWMPPIYDWFVEQKLPIKEFSIKDYPHIKNLKDEHPTPMAHFLYLEKHLPAVFDVTLDRDWAAAAESIVWESKGYREMLDKLKNELEWIENTNVMRGL